MQDIKYGKIVDLVHMLIKGSYLNKENLQFVDATCGNGFDTLFMCNIAGNTGKVIAFDIQEEAIERTNTLLKSNLEYKNYELIKDSHENINKYIKDEIDVCIFNLGYLPFSDKEVTTSPEVTCNAINNLLPILKKDGRIYITTYISHDNGHEIEIVKSFLVSLNNNGYNVIHTKIINKENFPPELFIIEKNA